MKLGDNLADWASGNYLLVGLAYAWQRDWWRVRYRCGPVLIVTATVNLT